jgi:hypothetical protein
LEAKIIHVAYVTWDYDGEPVSIRLGFFSMKEKAQQRLLTLVTDEFYRELQTDYPVDLNSERHYIRSIILDSNYPVDEIYCFQIFNPLPYDIVSNNKSAFMADHKFYIRYPLSDDNLQNYKIELDKYITEKTLPF